MAIRVYLSYSSQTGNRASAEGYYSHNGSLIVLKDSKICENIRFAADIDEAFINKLDKNYILTQKLRFPSATKAARFVCGGAPVNGKNIWRTKDGTPISELSNVSNDTGIISLRPLDEQFLAACASGRIEDAKQLYSLGANLNIQNNAGKTGLMAAIENKYWDIANWLLATKRCYIDARNGLGYSALIYAINSKNVKFVETLIKYGADVNLEDNEGKTPLMYAASLNGDAAELISIALVEAGADIEVKDKNNRSAYYYAKNSHNKEIYKFFQCQRKNAAAF